MNHSVGNARRHKAHAHTCLLAWVEHDDTGHARARALPIITWVVSDVTKARTDTCLLVRVVHDVDYHYHIDSHAVKCIKRGISRLKSITVSTTINNYYLNRK